MGLRDRFKYYGKPARPLREPDIVAWLAAADSRHQDPFPEEGSRPMSAARTRDTKAYLKSRNPVRFGRLQRDFKWAQKMLLKAGVDPEEVRNIL